MSMSIFLKTLFALGLIGSATLPLVHQKPGIGIVGCAILCVLATGLALFADPLAVALAHVDGVLTSPTCGY